MLRDLAHAFGFGVVFSLPLAIVLLLMGALGDEGEPAEPKPSAELRLAKRAKSTEAIGVVTRAPMATMPSVKDDPTDGAGTPEQAIAAPSNTGAKAFQRVFIQNTSASARMCVGIVDSATGCAASGLTCDGTGTDNGIRIVAGGSYTFPPLPGNVDVCVVDDGTNAANYQTVRDQP